MKKKKVFSPAKNKMVVLADDSTLTDAGNSVEFHRLAGNLDLGTCVLLVTRHSMLTQLVQKFDACR